MATLLEICTAALNEDGRFRAPTQIINNVDPTAVQVLALANRTGKELSRWNWQALIQSYTFTTDIGTDTYALPTDFLRFANLTFWDRAETEPLRGPTSPQDWEILKSDLYVSTGLDRFFRIAGNLFTLHPVPTSTDTIAYQYYSKNWISGKAAFTSDNDVPLIDNDLFTLGIRWRFLESKGLPYQEAKAEYLNNLDALQASDGAKGVVSFRARPVSPYGGLPDTGYGA